MCTAGSVPSRFFERNLQFWTQWAMLQQGYSGTTLCKHDLTLQTSCMQRQLVGVALSFLRNFGILSGASGMLGSLSSGVASAALDDRFAVQRAQEKQVSPDVQPDSVSRCCVVCHSAPTFTGGFCLTVPISAWPVSFLRACQQYQGLYMACSR